MRYVIDLLLNAVGFPSNNFFSQSRKPILNQMEQDLDEYDTVSEKIFEERRQIIEAIKNACSNRNVSSNNQCQFFQVRTPSGNNLRLKAEADEFSQELHELVNNYPKFKADRARTERGYIRELTRELVEHHAKTKQVAEFFLEQIPNVRDHNTMAPSQQSVNVGV